MKTIICFTILMFTFSLNLSAQSVMDFQTGSSVVVSTGADICADQVLINGNFSGGGTICGSADYVLQLSALIQGFYNPLSNSKILDTVAVILRSAVSPYLIVDSLRSILDANGAGSFVFHNITNGTSYYIILKHRNSIETWSSAGNSFTTGALTYDFTPLSSKAYGNNQIQVDLSPLRFGIYSGDVNQDGFVDLADITLVFNNASSFVSGYVVTDVNGDNVTDLSDIVITFNNSSNFVTVLKP